MTDYKKYPNGMFSWIDLNTTDTAAAKAFYAGVFGWSAVDQPLPFGGVYTNFQVDGVNVAGMGEMSAEMQAQGVPSMWSSYIAVDDAEVTTAKAAELGATVVMPVMDVMEEGRMSIIMDPTGATVGLWQAKNHPGAGVFNGVGSLSWNELATRDTAKAMTFYSDLLGWTGSTDESGYTMLMNAERANGGMIAMDESWGEAPAHWSPYIGVADINESIKQIKALGGTVMFGPIEAGEAGSFAKAADPTGAVFTAIQMKVADPSPELV